MFALRPSRFDDSLLKGRYNLRCANGHHWYAPAQVVRWAHETTTQRAPECFVGALCMYPTSERGRCHAELEAVSS